MSINYATTILDKSEMAAAIIATREIKDLPRKFTAGSLFHHAQFIHYADEHLKFYIAQNDSLHKPRASVEKNIQIILTFSEIVFNDFDAYKYEQREIGNMNEACYDRDLSDIDTDDIKRSFSQLARQSLGVHIGVASPFGEGDKDFSNASLLKWWFDKYPVRITRGDESSIMNVITELFGRFVTREDEDESTIPFWLRTDDKDDRMFDLPDNTTDEATKKYLITTFKPLNQQFTGGIPHGLVLYWSNYYGGIINDKRRLEDEQSLMSKATKSNPYVPSVYNDYTLEDERRQKYDSGCVYSNFGFRRCSARGGLKKCGEDRASKANSCGITLCWTHMMCHDCDKQFDSREAAEHKAKVKADKDKKKMSGIKIEGGYGTGCCVYIPNDPSDSPQNQFKDFEEAAASSKYRKCINPVDGDGFICEHCHVFTCIGHQLLHCCTGIPAFHIKYEGAYHYQEYQAEFIENTTVEEGCTELVNRRGVLERCGVKDNFETNCMCCYKNGTGCMGLLCGKCKPRHQCNGIRQFNVIYKGPKPKSEPLEMKTKNLVIRQRKAAELERAKSNPPPGSAVGSYQLLQLSKDNVSGRRNSGLSKNMTEDDEDVPKKRGNKAQEVQKVVGSKTVNDNVPHDTVHSNKNNRSSSSNVIMSASKTNTSSQDISEKSRQSYPKDSMLPKKSDEKRPPVSSSSNVIMPVSKTNTSSQDISEKSRQSNPKDSMLPKKSDEKRPPVLGNFINTQQRYYNQPSLSQESMVSTDSGGFRPPSTSDLVDRGRIAPPPPREGLKRSHSIKGKSEKADTNTSSHSIISKKVVKHKKSVLPGKKGRKDFTNDTSESSESDVLPVKKKMSGKHIPEQLSDDDEKNTNDRDAGTYKALEESEMLFNMNDSDEYRSAGAET